MLFQQRFHLIVALSDVQYSHAPRLFAVLSRHSTCTLFSTASSHSVVLSGASLHKLHYYQFTVVLSKCTQFACAQSQFTAVLSRCTVLACNCSRWRVLIAILSSCASHAVTLCFNINRPCLATWCEMKCYSCDTQEHRLVLGCSVHPCLTANGSWLSSCFTKHWCRPKSEQAFWQINASISTVEETHQWKYKHTLPQGHACQIQRTISHVRLNSLYLISVTLFTFHNPRERWTAQHNQTLRMMDDLDNGVIQ